MIPVFPSAISLWLGLAALASAGAIEAPPNVWTNQDGRKLTGSLLGVESGHLTLRTAEGNRVVIPMAQLEPGNQAYLREWLRARSPADALPPVVWPAEILAGKVALSPSVRVEQSWIMRTEHYQFCSDAELAVAAVQDLAAAGEATHHWLRAWPLPLPAAASAQRAIARIFSTREAYEAAGGTPQSGGFFRGMGRGMPGELLIPFQSLGLEASPHTNSFRKSLHFSTRTLIHEMAHQQMASVLPLMPLWLSEGLAEFAALPDYRAGKFQVSRAAMLTRLRQRWESYEARDPATGADLPTGQRAAGKDWTVPLATLLELREASPNWTLAEQHRIYLTSLLTVYYFLHLEGDGQARRLRSYWQELLQAQEFLATRGQSGHLPEGAEGNRAAIPQALIRHLLAGQTVPALQADLQKRLTASGLRVGFGP